MLINLMALIIVIVFFCSLSFKWIVQFSFRWLPIKPGTIKKRNCCDGRLHCRVIAFASSTSKHFKTFSFFFFKQNFIVALWLFVYYSFTNVIWLPISIVVWFSIDVFFFFDYLDCVVSRCFFWIFLALAYDFVLGAARELRRTKQTMRSCIN